MRHPRSWTAAAAAAAALAAPAAAAAAPTPVVSFTSMSLAKDGDGVGCGELDLRSFRFTAGDATAFRSLPDPHPVRWAHIVPKATVAHTKGGQDPWYVICAGSQYGMQQDAQWVAGLFDTFDVAHDPGPPFNALTLDGSPGTIKTLRIRAQELDTLNGPDGESTFKVKIPAVGGSTTIKVPVYSSGPGQDLALTLYGKITTHPGAGKPAP